MGDYLLAKSLSADEVSGMTCKLILAAFSLGALSAPAQIAFPGFDAARIGFTQTGDSDLEGDNGSFQVSRFELMSVLSRPITPANGLTILPVLDYTLTGFDFDDTPAGFPIQDEDLHSLSLGAYLISNCEGSPWMVVGWARAELASDFQHINGDDVTFDLAAGVGYRFSESLTVGVGGAVLNLNGDTAFYPGINFDWIVNEQLRISLYGPTFVAAYSPSEDWLFSFREDPFGGIWNITDDAGESRSIDFTSFRLGLYASRRLTGELWLTAGAGVTIGNELDYTTPGGRVLESRDSDSAMFGTIGLRLNTW